MRTDSSEGQKPNREGGLVPRPLTMKENGDKVLLDVDRRPSEGCPCLRAGF
jgi:hypothetical protein